MWLASAMGYRERKDTPHLPLLPPATPRGFMVGRVGHGLFGYLQ